MSEPALIEPKLHESPKCNFCGVQPMTIGSKQINTGHGLVLGITWCGNCGRLLSSQVIGMAQPMQLPHLRGNNKSGLII